MNRDELVPTRANFFQRYFESGKGFKDISESAGIGRLVIISLVALCLTFSVLAGNIVFIFLHDHVVEYDRKEGSLFPSEGFASENLADQPELAHMIGYMSSGNIWIYDLITRENTQLTMDGGINYNYTMLAWRNTREIAFSRCSSGQCFIETFDIDKQSTIDVFAVEADKIFAMQWSHGENKLAYLFKKQDAIYLTVKVGDIFKNLGKFSYDENRVFDIDDAICLHFSPDDEKVMVINTFVDNEDYSIVVFAMSGEEMVSVRKTSEILPTFGIFINDEVILYKKGNYLYKLVLSSNTESQFTDRIVRPYNLSLSPDRKFIAYWTHDWITGIATIWIYEIQTDNLKRVRDQESYPAWLDTDTLITLHFSDCSECTKQKFELEGFNRVDLDTRVVSPLLELEEIESFTVRND